MSDFIKRKPKRFIKDSIRCIDGEVTIYKGDEVLGFEIDFNGKCELENYDIPNWLIQTNKRKIIGVSLDGNPLGLDPFLKYVGKFNILNCMVVRNDMKLYKLYCYAGIKDRFENQISIIEEDSRYFDELNNADNVVCKNVYRTKLNINTNNLKTSDVIAGGKLKIDGNDYEGDYHITKDGKIQAGSSPKKITKKTNSTQRTGDY